MQARAGGECRRALSDRRGAHHRRSQFALEVRDSHRRPRLAWRHARGRRGARELLSQLAAPGRGAAFDADRAHARQWLPWVDAATSVVDSLAYIQRSLDRFAKGEGLSCGIWERGRLVGGISIQNFDSANRKAEIGYWLREGAQGRGIMTRACVAVVDYAIAELKLHRVIIFC